MSALRAARAELTPIVAGAAASVAATVLWALLAVWRPTVTLHLAPVLVAGIGPYVAWTRSRGRLRRDVVVSGLAGGIIAVLASVALGGAGWLEGPAWFGTAATREAWLLVVPVSVVAILLGAVAGDRESDPA